MNKISNIRFKEIKNSIYLKPFTMLYDQNGKEKFWDLMEIHDSVAIIIYNISRDVLIFVKQFRPGVYHKHIKQVDPEKPIDMDKYPVELGVTIELCAGIQDKPKSLVEIAKEEVLEECGYDVPLINFEKVHSYNATVGSSGSVLTMFYCEVTDDMKVSTGGGVDDELIEVVEMTVPEFQKYALSDSVDYIQSPGSIIIALYWFLVHKYKQTY